MGECFVDVNGINLCYRIDGEGDPIVEIHGFGSKKESFMAQTPVLSKQFKVISFDNRGSGKSERPNTLYSMDMFADDLKGLLDYLKIKKTHIIGLSMGGMIALTFISKYPKQVNKLVLINTLAKLPNNFDADAYIQSKIKTLKLKNKDPEKAFWDSIQFGFHTKIRREMKANPKKKFYGIWSAEDLLEYYKTNPSTPQDIRNIANSFKNYEISEKLSNIPHKTLLLTASHDKLVPKSQMLEIHKKLPNSILKIIEEAGHESPKSKAPEINQLIINFLAN